MEMLMEPYYHRCNIKICDSDGVDSLSEEELRWKTEDQRYLADEKPDVQDHFRDLELIRREANNVAWSMDRSDVHSPTQSSGICSIAAKR